MYMDKIGLGDFSYLMYKIESLTIKCFNNT